MKRPVRLKKNTPIKNGYYTKIIISIVISLTITGLIIVGSASVVAADRDFGNKWFYLRQQMVWATLGLIGLYISQKINMSVIRQYSYPIFICTVALLVAVLIPGIGTQLLGARRWINLGFTTFQPAELAKLAAIIYFANLYSKKLEFKPFILVTGLLALLVLLEPDMGTTLVILGISVSMYIGSGNKLKPLVGMIPLGVSLLILAIVISPYRLNRVKTFFNSSHDPLGSSYQVRQALISLGSGGLFGQGLGQSRQKYEFLPEVTTDSIFAVSGEEIGFIGNTILIILFLGLTMCGLQVARTQTDKFNSLLALGISSWFGFQSLINISAVVALVPFTGIPLSFISYGGTSLFLTLIASGMLINVSRDV